MKRTDINKQLAQYFTDEQLEPFDDFAREILLDTSSAYELRNLKNATSADIEAAIQEHLGREVLRRLAEIHEDELEAMLQWYSINASSVETIHCPEDGLIALKVDMTAPELKNKHTTEGTFVVGIVGKLLSYRQRLDGIIGYQCICGNDNMWSKIETDNIPHSHRMSVLTPDDMFAVQAQIAATKYVPNVKKLKLGYAIDKFEHRKVK